MACYGYCRCSHRESAAKGLSIASQVEAIRDYMAAAGLTDVGSGHFPDKAEPGFFLDEAQSAWKKRLYERPAGSELRRLLKAGDHVVFYNLDRGFRSVYDFSRTVPFWIKEGINVHLVRESFNLNSANGKLLGNILAAFAQWKSDMISERIRLAKAVLAEKKERKGRIELEPLAVSEETRGVAEIIKSRVDATENDAERVGGKVYLYGRVSHENSAKSGLGMGAQLESMRAYARYLLKRRPELSLAGEFEDQAVSAYKQSFFQRPAAGKLNNLLTQGDHVVFARLDRAWRGLKDMVLTLENWRERGVTAHFADMMLDTSSKTGDIFLQVMCMLAEWESSTISEKIKLAKAQLRKAGVVGRGDLTMGFSHATHNGLPTAVVNARDVYIMQWIAYMRDTHGLSFDKIADILEGHLARQENRKPIPPGGVHCRNSKLLSASGRKFQLRLREWGRARCHGSYHRWPKLREVVLGIMSSKRSDPAWQLADDEDGPLAWRLLSCTNLERLPTSAP